MLTHCVWSDLFLTRRSEGKKENHFWCTIISKRLKGDKRTWYMTTFFSAQIFLEFIFRLTCTKLCLCLRSRSGTFSFWEGEIPVRRMTAGQRLLVNNSFRLLIMMESELLMGSDAFLALFLGINLKLVVERAREM